MNPSDLTPELRKLLALAMNDPGRARMLLDRKKCLDSLEYFVRHFWPVLEPGTPLAWGWAMSAICQHLEALYEGKTKRLLITLPPGMAKSMLCSVMYPAWIWAKQSSYRVISASYSESLSIRDTRKTRMLLESPEFTGMFPDVKLDPDHRSAGSYSTTTKGMRTATSVGGTVTGVRGDLVIVDDPISVNQANSQAKREEALNWFTEVLPTRLNSADSKIMLIQQRVHEDDPAGHVIRNYTNWDRLILPMYYESDHEFQSSTCLDYTDPRTEEGDLLFPERFPKDYLENDLYPQLRSVGGEYAIASQMQQRPAPRGGGMFKIDGVQKIRFTQLPGDRVCVRGWDFAGSKSARAAFTAGVLMSMDKDGKVYIEDVARGQWSPGEVEESLLRCAETDPAGTVQDMPQDPGQAGLAQKAHIGKLLAGHSFTFSPESGSKESRALPLASQVEVENVYLVEGSWNEPFLSELASFPAGRLKDQVDAASRAYSKLVQTRPKQKRNPAPPRLLDFGDDVNWY